MITNVLSDSIHISKLHEPVLDFNFQTKFLFERQQDTFAQNFFVCGRQSPILPQILHLFGATFYTWQFSRKSHNLKTIMYLIHSFYIHSLLQKKKSYIRSAFNLNIRSAPPYQNPVCAPAPRWKSLTNSYNGGMYFCGTYWTIHKQ